MTLWSRRGGLLRERDFRHFWLADLISQFGTRINGLAVPLLAITVLSASALEVSLLASAQSLAFLLVGLPAGAWCDRMRCRPVLVLTDLGRAILIGSIPLAWAFDILTLAQMYGVVFLVGALTVFFDVSHQSYLPRLVGRAHLVEGNAKLQGNLSVAAVAGSSSGGILVQTITAPLTLVIDAASYLWSAGWLRTIDAEERRPDRRADTHLRAEIMEGLRLVFGHPVLRPIAANGSTMVLCTSAINAILVVFLVRDIGLSPGVIGVLGTSGLIGALTAAATARASARVLGQARAMLVFTLAMGVAYPLYALTERGWRLGFYVAAGVIASFSIVTLNVIQVSFRQHLCPDHLLGRMNATMRFVTWATMPVGSVAGGALATLAGFRVTIVAASVGLALSSLWLILSPLRGMRDLPTREGPPEAITVLSGPLTPAEERGRRTSQAEASPG